MSPIEFATERLRLRCWRESDLEPFAAMNADPRVMEFLGPLLSREESDALARRLGAGIGARGWGLWAVEVKGGEPFIGYLGLDVPSIELPFSPCVEIGWRLAASGWGRGYASEAARAILSLAFEALELAEVVSFTTVANVRSRRVMEKIGMKHRGETFEHPALAPGNPLRPHVLYSIQRGQWAGSRRTAAASHA